MRKIYILLLLSIIMSCQSNDIAPQAEEKENLEVLFIGNSHTYYNAGVNFHLQEIASSYGNNILAKASAYSGYSLLEHAVNENTIASITSEDWDFIFVQENTFIAAFESEKMLEGLQKLKSLLNKNAKQVFLFKTWAYNDRPEMNALLDTVYQRAFEITGYPILDIGNLWTHFHQTQNISLYAADGFHPNVEGTFLNTLLFYKHLFMLDDVMDCTYDPGISPEDFTSIKQFASEHTL